MTDIAAIPGVETVHARSVWVDPRSPVTGAPLAPHIVTTSTTEVVTVTEGETP